MAPGIGLLGFLPSFRVDAMVATQKSGCSQTVQVWMPPSCWGGLLPAPLQPLGPLSNAHPGATAMETTGGQRAHQGDGTTSSLVTSMSHSKFTEIVTPPCVPPEAGTSLCLNHRWAPCSLVLRDDVFIWTVPDGRSRQWIHLLFRSRQAPQGFWSWGQHINVHLS